MTSTSLPSKFSIVSLFQGVNPIARTGRYFDAVTGFRQLFQQSNGLICGFDVNLPDPGKPADRQAFTDMLGEIRGVGGLSTTIDISAIVFTPGDISLAHDDTWEAGMRALRGQIDICAENNITVAGGPIATGWCRNIRTPHVNLLESAPALPGRLATIVDYAFQRGLTGLSLEYLCRRETNGLNDPRTAATLCRSVNELTKAGHKLTTIDDTSHILDWVFSTCPSVQNVTGGIAASQGVGKPKRAHWSKFATRGLLDENTAKDEAELVRQIVEQGFDGTWAVEVFPWWDATLRGAILGFGVATFPRDGIIEACVTSAKHLNTVLDEISSSK